MKDALFFFSEALRDQSLETFQCVVYYLLQFVSSLNIPS